ncbi:M15 family metallopeptidase [Solitalea koreensis]|uniref:D-alanyl-D-alanine carboxypeptidase n=1 Tax=Solitalea koreensis TaxID=543615 RepID=A0A521D0A6_9SPHI|nr:M15 family metallopeptidase [Solitalea koreensis]SMO65098.1 D-alanyl-D-alanine carboxypeptidase [Solitalea koreensis]
MKNKILLAIIGSVLVGCSNETKSFGTTLMNFNKELGVQQDEKSNNDNTSDLLASSSEGEILNSLPSGNENRKSNSKSSDTSQILLPSEYFNVIKTVDGKQEVQNPSNEIVVVNKLYSLPENYIPNDLIIPNVTFSFGKQDIEKAYLRKPAADALVKMFQAAKLDKITLAAVSAYRSYKRQKEVFNHGVQTKGHAEAAKLIAVPGMSEHQTGLALDISSKSNGYRLDENFANTPEGEWLKTNAHHYGFILRYQKGKESITGYNYEPWHFRYVGVQVAMDLYNKDITLDEYVKNAKAI